MREAQLRILALILGIVTEKPARGEWSGVGRVPIGSGTEPVANKRRRQPRTAGRQRFDSALADIDAVLVTLPPDDATFGWDYPRLRDHLARHSIPHTVLSADPARDLPPRDLQSISSLLDKPTRPALRHG